MAARSVAVLKFVGSISLGLLTGVSYTLTAIAVPSFLSLPSASQAQTAFAHLQTRTLADLRVYTIISTSSLLLAYALSPKAFRHPYLLLTSLVVASSGISDLLLRPAESKTITSARETEHKRHGKRTLDSSYEVLGDSSEGEAASSEGEEDMNGEEIRRGMEDFRFAQTVRTAVAGLGFAMSVVGLWGDGF